MLRERDWGEYTGLPINQVTLPPSQFPPSVENAHQLADRASRFLKFLIANYDNRRVLGVGHGYFNRCVQATIEMRTVHQTPRWDNTERRTFIITTDVANHVAPTDFIVSEN